ncbi:MAG TPA: hypothetical protein PLB21_06385 [Actinomycetota bacterium]|mgnify:CR=1 FL=1|nr:hypothetical protein [Actinomycetota bacterium]
MDQQDETEVIDPESPAGRELSRRGLLTGFVGIGASVGLLGACAPEAKSGAAASGASGAAGVSTVTPDTSRFVLGGQLFPIGFLFGLGLETASEVALLAVTASSAASGSASLSGLLALPLLFAAGMSLFDTGNSLLFSRLYWTTGQSDSRRLTFNVSMTAVTAAVGLGIGLVYLAGLLADVGGLSWLSGIASISDHFEVLGFVLVLAYLVVWAVALVPRRIRPQVAAPRARDRVLEPDTGDLITRSETAV